MFVVIVCVCVVLSAGFVLGPAVGAIIRVSADASFQWVTTPIGIFVVCFSPFMLFTLRVPGGQSTCTAPCNDEGAADGCTNVASEYHSVELNDKTDI